jgi:hypothetical protein
MSVTKVKLSEKRKSLEELFLFQNTYWNLIKKIEEEVDLDVFGLEEVKYEDVESLIRMFALKVFHGDYDGSNPRFLAPSRKVNSLWTKFISSTGNYAKFCDVITNGDTSMIGRDHVIFTPELEAVQRTQEAFKTQFIDYIDLNRNANIGCVTYIVPPTVENKNESMVGLDDDSDAESTGTEREQNSPNSSPIPPIATSSPLQTEPEPTPDPTTTEVNLSQISTQPLSTSQEQHADQLPTQQHSIESEDLSSTRLQEDFSQTPAQTEQLPIDGTFDLSDFAVTHLHDKSPIYKMDEYVLSCFWSKKIHKRFYRCIVTKVHDDDTYDILYVDDKKKGTNVPPEHIKKYNPPPSITSHWSVIVTENHGNQERNKNNKPDDVKDDFCKACGEKGNLIECDYCPFSYHKQCSHDLRDIPDEEIESYDFKCVSCKRFERFGNDNSGIVDPRKRACERCTAKKIRCEYTIHKDVCDACYSKQLQCVSRMKPPWEQPKIHYVSPSDGIIQSSSKDIIIQSPEKKKRGRPAGGGGKNKKKKDDSDNNAE